MAFAALTSLRSTMECFANFSIHCFLPTFSDTGFFSSKEMKFLKDVIDELDESNRSKRVKALERHIREALHEFEDVVDFVRLNVIRDSQSCTDRRSKYAEIVRQEMKSFVKTVKKIKKEHSKVMEDETDDDNDDDDDYYYYNERKKKDDGKELVGVSDQLTKIKDQLIAAYKSYELGVISFVGVAGTGRSYFARTIFDEELNSNAYPLYRAWASVGPKYEFKEILVSILSQINDQLGEEHKLVAPEGDENIFEYLCACLKRHRYLIVLDDVWETRVWEYLKFLFPDENNGSRVFLTTHLKEVALSAKSLSIYSTRELSKEESWNLVSTVLFQKQNTCPTELKKAGKKVAENCRGLHVEVAKAAILLSKFGKKPQHWQKVAAEMENFVVKDAYDEMLEIYKIAGSTRSARITEKVLGLPHDVIGDTKNNDFPYELFPHLKVFALVGKAGIGKTALTRKIFEDPWTLSCYEHRVWLTLGPKYNLKRLWADILTLLDPSAEYRKMPKKNLEHAVRSILSGKRWLLVLDNVWNDKVWPYLYENLADIRCQVLVTTRLMKVTSSYFGEFGSNNIHTVPFLNKKESWNLLRERVFGKELCPLELEKAGKMIAEDCDGLPLTIVTVASFLSKADGQEYWNEVANKGNSVFEDVYRKISNVLYPSYKDLGVEFRTCFLYMAAFLEKYEIPISKLFMLCTVEGLLHSSPWELKKDFGSNYLGYLASNNVVLINDKKYNGRAKTCRLHSAFWHLCAREARKDKFLYVVNRYADGLSRDIRYQRRLCIQNNVLFAIKRVHYWMASVSTARSLLCFGPPHPYQVSIGCDDLNLLKVLDALAIRFYEFPIGILKLVLLKYLALTYDGKFTDDSISSLCNLECLIIQQHMSIRFPGDPSCLPMEIWDMKELKHLQIMGRNLPDVPRKRRTFLVKLSTLLDVRAESCTKSTLVRIPNLVKLGIRIELEPNASFKLSSVLFDCISHLKRLKSLKCVIVNPELKFAPPASSFSMLPTGLNKLSLSGLGYSWEHMRPIASLPCLLVLKLKCYAFRGAEWVMHEGDFSSLQYLLLEDTDLVHWRADDYCHLNSLQLLTITHCFKLKDIPWQCLPHSCKVELVDCNPSALERMPENYSARLYSSWEERNSSA